ncbi:hypothetical protein Gogos_019951, partial [Gossypium gossypioides]|nr:hypothetical protein [Gossypium gossypioides]
DLTALQIVEEKDDVIQLSSSSTGHSSLYDFYFVECFATTSVIHFCTMHHTLTNLWHPLEGIQIKNLKEKWFLPSYFNLVDFDRVYEKLHLFYFLCGRLGHGNSFCPIRLTRDVTTDDMGCDISLRAVGCRVVVVDNIWLQKGTIDGSPRAMSLNSNLGVNLEGAILRATEHIAVILGVKVLGHVRGIRECELKLHSTGHVRGNKDSVNFMLHFWDMFDFMSLCVVLEIHWSSRSRLTGSHEDLLLESPWVVRRLQHMLKLYNPHIVFFIKTKLDCDHMVRMRRCEFLHGIEMSRRLLRKRFGTLSNLMALQTCDFDLQHGTHFGL